MSSCAVESSGAGVLVDSSSESGTGVLKTRGMFVAVGSACALTRPPFGRGPAARTVKTRRQATSKVGTINVLIAELVAGQANRLLMAYLHAGRWWRRPPATRCNNARVMVFG